MLQAIDQPRVYVGFGIVVILLGLFIQNIAPFIKPNYKLDQATKRLIGESRDDTKDYLKLDDKQKSYNFVVPKTTNDDPNKYEYGRNETTYSSTLPINSREGVTYTDTLNEIDVTVTPKFRLAPAQKTDGDHIVYPMGQDKLVYTLKYNGLKEDIIVTKPVEQTNYQFELSLPSGVEARLDQQGNVGIYSSDPTLFGNISFGSDEDRAKVDMAREKGDKTNLVATIPYPVVKDATGKEYTDRASFTLSDKSTKSAIEENKQNLPEEVKEQMEMKTTRNAYTLTIAAKELKDLAYPISIDPTIQASNASDFTAGTAEGGIDIDTTNSLILRSPLSGGALGAWGWNTGGMTTMDQARQFHKVVAYNGYMYLMGGCIQWNALNANLCDTYYSYEQHATIDASGNLGTWSSAVFMDININVRFDALATNGYMYVFNGSTQVVKYARINSNGSLGSWATTNSMVHGSHGVPGWAVHHKGRIYVIEGEVTTDSSEYADIRGDGSLTTWTSLPAGQELTAVNLAEHQTVVYNDTIYVLGGWDGGSARSEVYYSHIQADGSLGSWAATTSMAASLVDFGAAAYKGYLYYWGGKTPVSNIVRYAEIYPNGTIGSWRTTSTLQQPVKSFASTLYEGYLYRLGGCAEDTGSGCVSPNMQAAIERAKVKPVGEVGDWTTATNTFATGRFHPATLAYRGFLYVIGGSTNPDDESTAVNTTAFAPINADGSIGTWTTSTVLLPDALIYHDLVAYNGYIYVVGGRRQNAVTPWVGHVRYNQVNPTTGDLTGGTWQQTTSINTERAEHATVAYNGYMYVFGGRNGGANANVLSSVERAQIGSSGAFTGSWSATGVAQLPGNRLRFEATVLNNRMYIVAGCSSISTGTCNGEASDILYSDSINAANGNFTSWTSISNAMGHNSYDYGSVLVDKNNLYIVGGQGTSPYAGAEFGSFDLTTGGLNSWTQSSAPTAHATNGDWATTIYNGFIYAVGGSGTRTLSYAPINNGGKGTTGTWATTTSLTAARSFGATAVYNGYIYYTGGCSTQDCSSNDKLATTEYTKINDNGTLVSPWSVTSSGAGNNMATARGMHSAIAVDGYLYVFGGVDNTPTANLNVEYTQLNAVTGAPGTWTTDSTNISESRKRRAAIASYEGYIYIVSGQDSTGTATAATVYAKTLSTGGLSADAGCGSKWCSGTSLPVALNHIGVAVNNGKIYISGGLNSGSTLQNTVYYASFGSPGIGSWTTANSRLSDVRDRHLSWVANGYIYVAGGSTSSTCINSVEYAPILSNGEPGAWQRTPNTATTRSLAAGVYYNGNAYIVAGQNCSGAISTVDRAVVHSIPRTGSYSRLLDFTNGVKPTKLITRGGKRTGSTVKVDYKTVNNGSVTFSNTQSISDTGYTSANAQNFNLGTSVTLSRYLFLRYTIDDSMSAVFPDDTNQTTLTDYDIYFTPNPGARLRGGRSFNSGSDRGLDAQPQ